MPRQISVSRRISAAPALPASLSPNSVSELKGELDDKTTSAAITEIKFRLFKQQEQSALEQSREGFDREELPHLMQQQAATIKELEDALEVEQQNSMHQAAFACAAFAEKESRWAEDEADSQAQMFESEARALNAEVEAAQAKELLKIAQGELVESKRELAATECELAVRAAKLNEQSQLAANLKLEVESLKRERNYYLERLEAKDVLLEAAQLQLDAFSMAAARTLETSRREDAKKVTVEDNHGNLETRTQPATNDRHWQSSQRVSDPDTAVNGLEVEPGVTPAAHIDVALASGGNTSEGSPSKRTNVAVALRKRDLLASTVTCSKSRRNPTSRFYGVSWHKSSRSWLVQVVVPGSLKRYHGSFQDEIEAAKKYDALVRAHGMTAKPLNFDSTPAEVAAGHHQAKSSSVYTGVYWCKSRNNWAVAGNTNGERMNLGCYKNEVEAARAYDKWARTFGKALNFPADFEVIPEAKSRARTERLAALRSKTATAEGETGCSSCSITVDDSADALHDSDRYSDSDNESESNSSNCNSSDCDSSDSSSGDDCKRRKKRGSFGGRERKGRKDEDSEEELSEYELLRLQNIIRNKAMMEALGLDK